MCDGGTYTPGRLYPGIYHHIHQGGYTRVIHPLYTREAIPGIYTLIHQGGYTRYIPPYVPREAIPGVIPSGTPGRLYPGLYLRVVYMPVCLPVTRVVYARMPPCYPGGVCATLSGTRVVYVLHSQVPGWYTRLLLPGWVSRSCYPGGVSRSYYPGGYPRVYNGRMVGIPVCTTVGRWVPRYVHPGIPWWVYLLPCMLPVCTPGYTSLYRWYHSDYTVVHAGGVTTPWALTLRIPWVRALGEPPSPPSCYERADMMRRVTPLFPCGRID